MSRGERVLIESARSADIEAVNNEQVFSQLINVVDRLEDDSAVKIDFGNDVEGLQAVLDGLGFHTIKDAANRVMAITHSNGSTVSGVYGMNETQTGGKILPMLEDTPVTTSLQAILGGDWNGRIRSNRSSLAFLAGRFGGEFTDDDLLIVVSCDNLAELDIPEWDEHYGDQILEQTDPAQKIIWLGAMLMTAEDEDEHDKVHLPQQNYSMSILRGPNIFFTFMQEPKVKNFAGSLNYKNGCLEGEVKLAETNRNTVNAASPSSPTVPTKIALWQE